MRSLRSDPWIVRPLRSEVSYSTELSHVSMADGGSASGSPDPGRKQSSGSRGSGKMMKPKVKLTVDPSLTPAATEPKPNFALYVVLELFVLPHTRIRCGGVAFLCWNRQLFAHPYLLIG